MKQMSGKLRLELVPTSAIISMAEVFDFGAHKYEPWDWTKTENAQDLYYAALLRHLIKWRRGEAIDKESGLSHLKHVLTNAAMLQYLEEQESKNV